jgi:hypothetical protein
MLIYFYFLLKFPYIKAKITNIPAPMISKEIENKFKSMFDQIQEPFENYCPKDRVNFTNFVNY